MNKKELVKAIKQELKRQEKNLKVLEELQTIDFKKYDQKKLTKRITNSINEQLKESKTHFTFQTYIRDELTLCFFNIKGYERISLNVNTTGDPLFNESILIESISKNIKYKKETILKLKHDIKHIVTKINLYNKIVELEEKLSNETSYQFRNTARYTRNTYHKIANPNKEERILEYLELNQLENNMPFTFENKNYIAYREVKKQIRDYTLYTYSYKEVK